MSPAERWLRRWLIFSGSILMAAVFAIGLPTDWMAATHRFLGLGELPRVPLMEYLTRSISALYAAWGLLIVVMAFDIPRYLPLILLLAWLGLLHAFGMIVLDLWAGMPVDWTISEGLSILIIAVVQWLLARAVRRERADWPRTRTAVS